MSATASVEARLQAQLMEAGERLQRRSGGAALCAPTPGCVEATSLKYAEGQWAALREVQRSIRGGMAPAAALTTVVNQWTEDLARRRSQGAGEDWIWYRAGGLDAMEQLADSVTYGAHPGQA
ncbi:MAG TPA: hypothetical protein VGK17_21675 [Propionicimonas sp.]|jgi:hypothetical protein